MPIIQHTSFGSGTRFDFQVSQAGMKVSVQAGPMIYRGAELLLEEDEAITFATPSVDVDVIAYLVIDKATERLRVMVDEVELDGVDTPYTFTSSSPYTLITDLYVMKMPAGTTTLDGVDIRVKRAVGRDG